MSFQAQIITIFVSSPSDVNDDRRIVLDELHGWNQRNGRARGCYLAPLTWEDLVAPDVAASAQDVINDEVGDDYDVFLGLMWGRFGSPTGKAASGTQEEFERALARRTAGDALRISFLFKTADVPLEKIEPDQIKQVNSFKKAIADKGALFSKYSDDRELVSGLTTIFDRIANEKERYSNSLPSIAEAQQRSKGENHTLGTVQLSQNDAEGDELGLFDLEDELKEVSTEFAGHLTAWGDQFVEMSSIASQVTERVNELSQFGQPDRSEVRLQIDRVTEQLTDFADFGKAKIELIENNLDRFSTILSQMISVSRDFENSPEDIQSAKDQTAKLIETVSQTKVQMSEFIVSLEALPRLDKRFLKARSAVVIVHKRLRKKMELFESNMAMLLETGFEL